MLVQKFTDKSSWAQKKSRILCFYTNSTNFLQVIRITNFSKLNWEKVIFLYQRVLFEAIDEARLEVYSSENSTSLLANVIPCQKLRVTETTNE